MDYTKDAILIHHEAKSHRSYEERESSSVSSHSPPQKWNFISNASAMIGKTLMSEIDLAGVVKGNGSSLFPTSLPPALSSFSPSPELEDDYNDTMEYIPMSMRPETYIVPVLFAIIFIIGVIGNGTLIVIFIKHRSMRNVPNMFIVSLAIGDLLVILFCVPFTSTLYTLDSWPYGLVVCKFSEFVKDLSVGVSVFTLTALSADRYFAIVDPMRKLTGRRATRITIISIAGIWALSILVALPSALYSYVRVFTEYDEGEEEYDEEAEGRTFQVCYPYPTEFGHTYAQVMVMFHFLVYYAIPLFFIGTFYIIMARHLVLSTRNMPGEAQGQVKQIQARKKVAKMILSFVVIFAICFFPHHLFLLWFYFNPESENSFNAFWNICRIVGFCLSFINSCINPITLYCVSGTFRKQFNEHLFCCFCDKTGSRTFRGGRFSLGGTLAGGGGNIGGGGGGGPGMCAACASLSGNHGNVYVNNGRYGDGVLDRFQSHRGSNWDTMSKRRSTWDTQTTVVNHRVMNLNGAMNGAANIHINLCSEHEHIPLKTLKRLNQKQGKMIERWDEERGKQKHNIHRNHQHCFSARSSFSQDECYPHGGRVRRLGSFDRADEKDRLSVSPNYPSRIEEETSGSGSGPPSGIEPDQNSRNSHSHSHSSPTRSLSKVGEILSKLSPTRRSTETCSSLKRRDTDGESGEVVGENDGSLGINEYSVVERDQIRERNLKNNNDYLHQRSTTAEKSNLNGLEKNTPESGEEEYTVTSFISVPESSSLAKRSNVIICYN